MNRPMNNLELIIACVLIITVTIWLGPDPDAPRTLLTVSTPHEPYVCVALDPDQIVWDEGADPLREILWAFIILVVYISENLPKEQKAITPHNIDAGDIYITVMEFHDTYCSEEEGYCAIFPFYTWA